MDLKKETLASLKQMVSVYFTQFSPRFSELLKISTSASEFQMVLLRVTVALHVLVLDLNSLPAFCTENNSKRT